VQIVVEVPAHYPDALQREPEDFVQEAKLFEMKRLSSGMAARLIGLDRVTFLAQLQRFGVPMIDIESEEVMTDIGIA